MPGASVDRKLERDDGTRIDDLPGCDGSAANGRKRPLAQTETPDALVRAGALTRRGRSTAALRPAFIRYARRHFGFLAGLLIVAVVIGVTYRYLFDPLDERTVPF